MASKKSAFAVSIAGIVAITALFFMFAPEDRVWAVQSKWRSVTGDPGQVCFDIWANDLREPKTARIKDDFIYEGRVTVFYLAKNGYGNTVSGEFSCPLTDGKVDKIATSIEHTDNFIKRFDAQ